MPKSLKFDINCNCMPKSLKFDINCNSDLNFRIMPKTRFVVVDAMCIQGTRNLV
jgi:hypothetical protein